MEDDPAIRERVRPLLEAKGHSVAAAADGAGGRELKNRGYDLLILDVLLPDRTGYDLPWRSCAVAA